MDGSSREELWGGGGWVGRGQVSETQRLNQWDIDTPDRLSVSLESWKRAAGGTAVARGPPACLASRPWSRKDGKREERSIDQVIGPALLHHGQHMSKHMDLLLQSLDFLTAISQQTFALKNSSPESQKLCHYDAQHRAPAHAYSMWGVCHFQPL